MGALGISLPQIIIYPFSVYVKLTHSAKQPQEATPHHLVFIADPQLVDPHTYPGRPWPLSALTIRHTDLYLRRSFSLLQKNLHSDTVFFLGDLFDGGREWATPKSTSFEKRWRKYGENFWLKEYNRFGRIFFDHWDDGGVEPSVGQKGRKIIASLPGNHDLGIGTGIQLPVRERFQAYFGDGSRIDVIANHTIVSVDTVSLSAMDQPEPAVGSLEAEHPHSEAARSAIWKPVQEFLNQAQAEKNRAVERELRLLNNQTSNRRLKHIVEDLATISIRAPQARDGAVPDLPTILLTHVPLYRPRGTPCGPKREHWPPSKPSSKESEPLSSDEANAIAVQGGYQYQNVLTPAISKDLIEKVGNVGYVFSGDDHDYCEVVHGEYTASSTSGRVREITVKSMSWAMGVRKPGFLMLSLWNPIDSAGKSIGHGSTTLESHLCLLPDQLKIFMWYAVLLGLTLATLLIRSAVKVMNGTLSDGYSVTESQDHLLPIIRSNKHHGSSAENEKAQAYHQRHRADSQKSLDGSQSSNSSTSSNNGGLAVRSSAARTRSLSPVYGYGIPVSQADHSFQSTSENTFTDPEKGQHARIGRGDTPAPYPNAKHRLQSVLNEAFFSIRRVAGVALLWYIWLILRN